MSRVDVAVVGAGIVGASCAHHLAQRGLDVVVLEQSEAPAMGSTGKSAAGVRVQFTTETNVLMSKASLPVYRDFEATHGIDVGYQSIGYLLLVPPDRWKAHLAAVEMQRRLGVPVDVLTPDEAQRYVTFDAGTLAGATYGPMDGVVDPHMATHAWVRLARDHGVEFRYDAAVGDIARDGEGWRLVTPQGDVTARWLVNAAGPWSGEVAAKAGLTVPVRPKRCMIFLTEPTSDPRTYPLTIDLETGFYLRSEGDRVLFGRTNPEEPYGFVDQMNWDWLEEVLATGFPRFPWMEEVGLDRRGSWFGFYEVTPDHNPIIGVHPGTSTWIDATGFSGHGIMHAPITGQLVAELVADGRAHSISLDDFRHDRFAKVATGDANIF